MHQPAADGVPLERGPGLVLISDTPKGRGIFASCSIPARTVVEICPVLILTPSEVEQHIQHTSLDHYTYNWPCPGASATQAIVLGLGSMFNHSKYKQNVAWKRDVAKQCIVYTTLRDIEIGEELCISYGSKLWFEDAERIQDDVDEECGLENIDIL